MSIYDLSTNQVLLILLALWSIGFWVSGWVAKILSRVRLACGR